MSKKEMPLWKLQLMIVPTCLLAFGITMTAIIKYGDKSLDRQFAQENAFRTAAIECLLRKNVPVDNGAYGGYIMDKSDKGYEVEILQRNTDRDPSGIATIIYGSDGSITAWHFDQTAEAVTRPTPEQRDISMKVQACFKEAAPG